MQPKDGLVAGFVVGATGIEPVTPTVSSEGGGAVAGDVGATPAGMGGRGGAAPADQKATSVVRVGVTRVGLAPCDEVVDPGLAGVAGSVAMGTDREQAATDHVAAALGDAVRAVAAYEAKLRWMAARLEHGAARELAWSADAVGDVREWMERVLAERGGAP